MFDAVEQQLQPRPTLKRSFLPPVQRLHHSLPFPFTTFATTGC